MSRIIKSKKTAKAALAAVDELPLPAVEPAAEPIAPAVDPTPTITPAPVEAAVEPAVEPAVAPAPIEPTPEPQPAPAPVEPTPEPAPAPAPAPAEPTVEPTPVPLPATDAAATLAGTVKDLQTTLQAAIDTVQRDIQTQKDQSGASASAVADALTKISEVKETFGFVQEEIATLTSLLDTRDKLRAQVDVSLILAINDTVRALETDFDALKAQANALLARC